MKHAFDEDILPCVRQMASLFREAKNQEGGLYLGSALVYLLAVVDHRKKEDFIEIISESVSEEIGEDVMVTVSQYYERQGFKKGVEHGRGEGVEKGRKEEKMNIIREMVSRKMPLETISEITKLSVEELKAHLVEA